MPRPSVFLSYSHEDNVWKDRLFPHLRILEHLGVIDLWHDRRIDAGETWYPEIRQAMERAAAAVCLISAPYLASAFCFKEEVPYLLERRARDGMLLLPVLVSACPWRLVPWLSSIQMLPQDGRPVAELADGGNRTFTALAELLARRFSSLEAREGSQPGLERRSAPPAVSLNLPATGWELFGRDEELRWLEEAWESRAIRVASLVGWAGSGKSTLVNRWLDRRLVAEGSRGARRIFGWSFESQGERGGAASSDLFIASALRWFGDPAPSSGSPWARAERLADRIREELTILVLDALEPFQSEAEGGRLQDPALTTLLAALAHPGGGQPGLSIITSRQPVVDLADSLGTVTCRDLERISPQAGRALLRVAGVEGSDEDLETLSRAFGGNALAIRLLAAWLRGRPAGGAALEIPDLALADSQGRHARRVMEAFARRFGPGPELELLLALSLFQGPAPPAALAALRASPAIPDLTVSLSVLAERDLWGRVEELRLNGLLSPSTTRLASGFLEAHPLVREHFSQRLTKDHAAAVRQGHSRLFDYFRGSAEPFPATLEGLAPLYAAVTHGCRAGRYSEALTEVYKERIQRGDEFFAIRRLGAAGADLAALACFFSLPWEHPTPELPAPDGAYLLSEAGSRLRALGRLAEAAGSTAAALELFLAQGSSDYAAALANNLSEIRLALGDLAGALAAARQCLALADPGSSLLLRSGARTTLAEALHQTGAVAEAAACFAEAERLQAEQQPEYPLLYSFQGFRFGEFLQAQGKWTEAAERAGRVLSWAARFEGVSLLDTALAHLALGQALLRNPAGPDLQRAEEHLGEAVDGLRQAGLRDLLPRGLLARAELRRVKQDLARAHADLAESLAIAARSGLRLTQADALLERARLNLAAGDRDGARESLWQARQMIVELGYHRRDREVEDLDQRL